MTAHTNTDTATGYVLEVTDLRRGGGYLHSIKKAKSGRITYLVAKERHEAHRFADETLATKWAARMARDLDLDVEVTQ